MFECVVITNKIITRIIKSRINSYVPNTGKLNYRKQIILFHPYVFIDVILMSLIQWKRQRCLFHVVVYVLFNRYSRNKRIIDRQLVDDRSCLVCELSESTGIVMKLVKIMVSGVLVRCLALVVPQREIIQLIKIKILPVCFIRSNFCEWRNFLKILKQKRKSNE